MASGLPWLVPVAIQRMDWRECDEASTRSIEWRTIRDQQKEEMAASVH